jgi:transcriptional regulator with XRE-family HTH domain
MLYTVVMFEDEVRRFARLLEATVRVSRVPVREVERRLGMGAGTLPRIFSGKIDLKMRHILGVLAALDVPADRFFETAYKKQMRAPGGALAGEVLELVDTRGPATAPLETSAPKLPPEDAISDDELQRRILEALRTFGIEPRKTKS